jgi:hypothetical protein
VNTGAPESRCGETAVSGFGSGMEEM